MKIYVISISLFEEEQNLIVLYGPFKTEGGAAAFGRARFDDPRWNVVSLTDNQVNNPIPFVSSS